MLFRCANFGARSIRALAVHTYRSPPLLLRPLLRRLYRLLSLSPFFSLSRFSHNGIRNEAPAINDRSRPSARSLTRGAPTSRVTCLFKNRLSYSARAARATWRNCASPKNRRNESSSKREGGGSMIGPRDKGADRFEAV